MLPTLASALEVYFAPTAQGVRVVQLKGELLESPEEAQSKLVRLIAEPLVPTLVRLDSIGGRLKTFETSANFMIAFSEQYSRLVGLPLDVQVSGDCISACTAWLALFSQAESQSGTIHLRLKPEQRIGFVSPVYAKSPNRSAEHVYELEMAQAGVNLEWLHSHPELFVLDGQLHSLTARELCSNSSGILRPSNCIDDLPNFEEIAKRCQASDLCSPRASAVRDQYSHLSWREWLWLITKIGRL